MMLKSDEAWLALAAGVAAYDLVAIDDEQLSKATRRYFKAQPVSVASNGTTAKHALYTAGDVWR
jgi:hypothetical protein